MLCQLTIDQVPYSFELEGDFFWGENEILAQSHQHLFSRWDYYETGYQIIPLFKEQEWSKLQADIASTLKSAAQSFGLKLPANFEPEQYHRFVTNPQHQQVIEKTRFLTYGDFSVDFETLAGRISRAIGHPFSLHNPLLEKEIVILRISRPQSLDINPPHRDGYLNLWQKVVNVWIPIVGSNGHSSLPVIPGSHQWNEKSILRTAARGASINGLPYHVPGIAGTAFGLPMMRPNPKPGEALIFTPYLIHGAAINANTDQTRMALELRLYGG